MLGAKFFHPWVFLLTFTGQKFNYDDTLSWKVNYPGCVGFKQSPIDLFYGTARPGNDIPPISFENYDDNLAQPIYGTNNGHTVSFGVGKTKNGKQPTISGGGLEGSYEAQSFHFHWGSQKTRGSEHRIDLVRYDMEMHIVHKNVKYPTMEEAMKHRFGFVVLGVLFKKIIDDHMSDDMTNDIAASALPKIADAVSNLTTFESKQAVKDSFKMSDILGNIRTKYFFTYRGSLTTPPCSQAVTWFVFSDVIPIPIKYLKRFWNILDSRGLPLLDNFRPTQPTLLRKIYYSQ